MFGSTRERFIGQLPDAFRRRPSPTVHRRANWRWTVWVAIAGEPQRFEWVHTRGDGSLFDAEVSLSAFEEPGRALIIGVVRDITERKKAEAEIRDLNATLEARVVLRTRELAQANTELEATLGNLQRAQDELLRAEKLASLGALVAGIAHELNTPIGNAVTVSSTLLDEQRRFSEKMAWRPDAQRARPLRGRGGRSGADRRAQPVPGGGIDRQLQATGGRSVELPAATFDLQDVVREIMLAMAPSSPHTFRIIDEVPGRPGARQLPGAALADPDEPDQQCADPCLRRA